MTSSLPESGRMVEAMNLETQKVQWEYQHTSWLLWGRKIRLRIELATLYRVWDLYESGDLR